LPGRQSPEENVDPAGVHARRNKSLVRNAAARNALDALENLFIRNPRCGSIGDDARGCLEIEL
jgi:hypothetical protein